MKHDPFLWVIGLAIVLVIVVILVVALVPTNSGRHPQWYWRTRSAPLPLKPQEHLLNDALGSQFGSYTRFSSDGSLFYVAAGAYATDNGLGYIYDMPSGDLRAVVQRESPGDFFGLTACFSRDNTQLVTTSAHTVWRLLIGTAPLDRELIKPPTLDSRAVPSAVVFTNDDGQLIYTVNAPVVTGGDAVPRTIVCAVFSDKLSQPRQTLPHGMEGLRVTRDGVMWGVDTVSQQLRTYVQNEGYWQQLPHNIPSTTFAVSEDGSYLISYTRSSSQSSASSLITYEMEMGQITKVVQTFNNYPRVTSLATTDTGKYVTLVRAATAAASTVYLFQKDVDNILGTSQVVTSTSHSTLPLNVNMTSNETGTLVITVGDPSFFERRGQVEWWTVKLS